MAGDPTPQTHVQGQWLSWTCSEEEPERQTNTNQHHSRRQDTHQDATPSLCYRFQWTNREDVPTTGSENSEVRKHPQKLSSEGDAGQTRHEQEGYSLWLAMQGLPMCVHWRDRKNLGETSVWAQDSSEEEWPQEQHCSSCLGEPELSQLGEDASVRQDERGYIGREESSLVTLLNLFLTSSPPFIIRCLHFITNYTISTSFMTPTDTPTLIQRVALYQFFVLQLKTIYKSKRPVPYWSWCCALSSNLPLQREYEVEMDNYQFSKKHYHNEYMLANYNVLVGPMQIVNEICM